MEEKKKNLTSIVYTSEVMKAKRRKNERSWRRPTTHDPFLSSSNLKWIMQQKRDINGKTGKNPNNVCI